MNNNNYKKIKIKNGDKIYSAFEIKKKSNLIYCKKFLKKLTRSNSNTNSNNSTVSIDSDSSNISDINIELKN